MIDFKKIALYSIAVTLLSSNALAKDNGDKDYDADYYSDEGRINFKVRGFGALMDAKQQGMPAPTSIRGKALPQKNSKLVANGFGAEAVTALFFSDRIAAEFGLGWGLYRVSMPALHAVANNYSDTAVVGKRKNIYAFPITLTGQYHFAPFGAIRPYAGGGYGGAYFISKNKELKIKPAHGMVIQVGTDFVMTDDTLINLDIKKYTMEPKAVYKTAFLGNNTNVAPKIKMNPLVISLGVGMKF